MVASSVLALAVFISSAVLTLVMKTAWISEPSSVQSITANLSVDGSTSGNPIWKWKVIWSLWTSNKYISLWTVVWMNGMGKIAACIGRVSVFILHCPGPSWPRFSFSSVGFVYFSTFFFHKTSLASHMHKLKRSCVWNVLKFLNLLLTFQQLSLPGMLIAIGMNCPDQKFMKPYMPHGDTILSNWHGRL